MSCLHASVAHTLDGRSVCANCREPICVTVSRYRLPGQPPVDGELVVPPEHLITATMRLIEKGSHQRASELSDELGALRTSNLEILAENATLRRRVEQLERKVRK